MRTRPALALTLFAGAIMACGESLPRPKTGPGRADQGIEVPYPPPAARVELVPTQPHKDAVWVDGQWSWLGNRWRWQNGGWVMAPAGAYLARWRTVRRPDGALLFVAAAWFTSDHVPLPWPAVLAQAQRRARSEESAP